MEVAIKFSGDQGIVIQLDNPNTPQYNKLYGFNCSWISRYKEEDERLFFGGYRRIKIESIRIRNNKRIWQNYEPFIFSLFYIDSLFTGSKIWNDYKISDDDVIIINELFNNILGKSRTKTFDEYIYSTFHSFCQHKKQIILDLYQLDNFADEKVTDFIMNSLDGVNIKYDEEKKRYDGDLSNIFRKDILGIFKNIKSLIIITTSETGYSSYSLSLLSLIDSISF